MQMFNGISFKADDQVIYNDNIILDFNHKSDSSQAAFTTVEELNGEIKEAEAVDKVDSLNLQELSDDQREKLDIMDVDFYLRKQDDLKVVKDTIKENIRQNDRYANPLMVLDTDYSDFLITFQCRQEFRKPRDEDYMLHDHEKYREAMESYESKKHD